MATAAATTKASPSTAARRRGGSGPDRVTVALLSLTGFLVVLTLLAWQLSSSAPKLVARQAVMFRRVYQTTVIETIPGSSSGSGAVTQSVSSSGSSSTSGAAPTTRTS